MGVCGVVDVELVDGCSVVGSVVGVLGETEVELDVCEVLDVGLMDDCAVVGSLAKGVGASVPMMRVCGVLDVVLVDGCSLLGLKVAGVRASVVVLILSPKFSMAIFQLVELQSLDVFTRTNKVFPETFVSAPP